MRHAAHSTEIAELAVRHRDAGVVGFDIAGSEAGNPPTRHLDAFQLVAAENFHITIHAGEAFGLPSIWEAVQLCGAERLGHGVRIVDDIEVDDDGRATLGRLASFVRDRRVPLEMCPTSNVNTGVCDSIAEHPIGLLARLRFRVTVNTDNRLMSGVSLTSEMAALVDAFGYGWDEIEWLTLNAMKSSFWPFDQRLRIINQQIKPAYAQLRAQLCVGTSCSDASEAVEDGSGGGAAEAGGAGVEHRERGGGVADAAAGLDAEAAADRVVPSARTAVDRRAAGGVEAGGRLHVVGAGAPRRRGTPRRSRRR